MKNIKELREEKGFTQVKLAGILDCDFQYISNIETGIKNISLEKFAEICIALGYTQFETMQFISENLGFDVELHSV
jgi:transcriptional regulator with XRE-family HTH domain